MNAIAPTAPTGQLNKAPTEARRLGLSLAQLRSLHRSGVIPGVRVSERVLLFNSALVDAALEKHRQQTLPKSKTTEKYDKKKSTRTNP